MAMLLQFFHYLTGVDTCLTESQTGSLCSLVIKGAFPLCLKPTVFRNYRRFECNNDAMLSWGQGMFCKESQRSFINKIRSQKGSCWVVKGMLNLESKGLGLDLALSQPGSVTSGKSFNLSGSLFFKYKMKE